MKIIACDPGTFETGYVIFDGSKVIKADIVANENMIHILRYAAMDESITDCAIEMVEARGMPVGKETFETVLIVGRLFQQWLVTRCTRPVLIFRRAVKIHLCGSTKAKDGNIRQALIDKIGPVGVKKNPGPCFGVTSHCWAALAVAVTALNI